MNKSKHTPGEWKINEFNDCIYSVKTGTVLFEKAHSGEGQTNFSENSKLVAAAPEMLEALINANQYFIDLQNKCALTSHDERAWKSISKAIFKATF